MSSTKIRILPTSVPIAGPQKRNAFTSFTFNLNILTLYSEIPSNKLINVGTPATPVRGVLAVATEDPFADRKVEAAYDSQPAGESPVLVASTLPRTS
jgi:hypothetical protein